jgi:integrase
MGSVANVVHREPWNRGKIVGQKAPFKLKDIWALRVRLQMESRVRELALFNLGIDSKLRGSCRPQGSGYLPRRPGGDSSRGVAAQDPTPGAIRDHAGDPRSRAEVDQTSRAESEDFLFPSRIHDSPHLGTRQYARILDGWVEELGLDPADYGTHSMRRTKATLIYRRTKNLRAVQLLLGHSKLESTVRYLGIEVDDALEISEQTEI